MRVRKATFPPPISPPRHTTRTFAVSVTSGLHAGLAPHELPLGYASLARNLTPERDQGIAPRSGLSRFGTYAHDGPVLGAAEVFDVYGNSCLVAPSRESIGLMHPLNDVWSDLSYVASNITHFRGALSGTSTDYFRVVGVYDQGLEDYIAVVSNNTDTVKYFEIAEGTTTFSDFSWLDSLDSMALARDVNVVNDRLVFFNLENSNGTRFPTRVLWSARGDPRNFAIASEAGFEDLMEMKGEGQRCVRFRDFLLLFTELEIWRATPTLDAYAFRFDRVSDNVGCPYPKTIAVTPLGVIFMEHDRELYITDGATVAPLGPVNLQGPSRVRSFLASEIQTIERAWATYSHVANRYELYYVGADSSDGYPNRALFYDLASRSFWPQTFPWGISSGAEFYDPAAIVTYDELDEVYDDVSLDYDAFDARQKNRRVNVFTSAGSTHRYISSQTNDDGNAIDVRWRSPGMRDASMRQRHLTELWTTYAAGSASSMSVFVGDAFDTNSFEPAQALSLSSPGGVIFTPTWLTAVAPAFEFRIADGGQPRITSFSATVKDASKF